jgi:diguanylate cyclase (GGDEF)-like protein
MNQMLNSVSEQRGWQGVITEGHYASNVLFAKAAFLNGSRGALVVTAGLLSVALIAVLDYQTGPELSFGIFYLLPVAAGAWWGGFSHGILLAIGGAIAWHSVDGLESPLISPVAGVWNGVVRFGTLALVSSLVSRLHMGVRRERLLARTDPLTGAANGRTFYETVAVVSERARRTLRPLTLAYIDLDNFKQLNDRLGHAAGDMALRHVVQSIRSQVRHTDLLARLGGDEFALVLPDMPADGMMALLDRVRDHASREMARKGWPVTLSVGAVTFLHPAEDVDQMVRQVDALMYSAKRKGKGRVEHTVVQDAQDDKIPQRSGVEKRVAARLLCNQSAQIREDGAGGDTGEFATVRDISAEGVRIFAERQFSPGTLLIVEPLSLEAKTLLARVIYSVPAANGWQHGCSLSSPLDGQDLNLWAGEPFGCKPLPGR